MVSQALTLLLLNWPQYFFEFLKPAGWNLLLSDLVGSLQVERLKDLLYSGQKIYDN